jgi:plasmid stabilization system protein ParE
MLPFRLHPAADAEAIDAATTIKADDPYEAALFKEALQNAINRARRRPENYRKFDGEFGKVRVGKFSCAVIFRERDEEIQILAVMHLHRKPGYWKNRAKTWPE